MHKNMEIVRFNLVSETSTEEFLRANEEVERWVRRQAGFSSRHLCLDAAGRWTDIVLWNSEQCAKQAADQFIKDLNGTAFMRMIDFSTVEMTHQTVLVHCLNT
ncbi:hypothetical protein RF679_13430 [Undibacterium cyanobacteriorum]|uniref:ABM domain-containing protein n=1 Tax=Undibacterium cyanobacteriorum TaxID=3073561 RepID=A0ABY9RH88_9BURK|nr:hypothetical protein [Undibacterium sp. 20NA77.5]WMW79647.1 hypothetical protein RF679_13430 [Undibacterium sp. 20NA77.5]